MPQILILIGRFSTEKKFDSTQGEVVPAVVCSGELRRAQKERAVAAAGVDFGTVPQRLFNTDEKTSHGVDRGGIGAHADGVGGICAYVLGQFVREFDEREFRGVEVERAAREGASGEDHAADETRYFLMSRPIRPRNTDKPDKSNPGPLHLFLDIEEGTLPKAAAPPGLEVLGAPE